MHCKSKHGKDPLTLKDGEEPLAAESNDWKACVENYGVDMQKKIDKS